MTDLVLADDATGALECASLLAGLGHDAVCALELPVQMPPHRFFVLDTETRHQLPTAAGQRIRECLARPHGRVFKKTDSTLRGNIAAELDALRETRLVYVPAYPALGRTVRLGRLYVDGVPVAETAFGADARQPVRSSALADLFPANTRLMLAHDATELRRHLRSEGIIVCDAETDEDLAAIAAVLRESAPAVPVASPAGFIRFWAGAATTPAPPLPRVQDWLIVCGSLHPQSREQARRAEAAGLRVVQTESVAAADPSAVAADLAQRCVAEIRQRRPSGILVMGGDTARALWQALGVVELAPLPEVLPGVAVSRAAEFVFVTKAGGFGGDTLVEQVLERLQ